MYSVEKAKTLKDDSELGGSASKANHAEATETGDSMRPVDEEADGDSDEADADGAAATLSGMADNADAPAPLPLVPVAPAATDLSKPTGYRKGTPVAAPHFLAFVWAGMGSERAMFMNLGPPPSPPLQDGAAILSPDSVAAAAAAAAASAGKGGCRTKKRKPEDIMVEQGEIALANSRQIRLSMTKLVATANHRQAIHAAAGLVDVLKQSIEEAEEDQDREEATKLRAELKTARANQRRTLSLAQGAALAAISTGSGGGGGGGDSSSSGGDSGGGGGDSGGGGSSISSSGCRALGCDADEGAKVNLCQRCTKGPFCESCAICHNDDCDAAN